MKLNNFEARQLSQAIRDGREHLEQSDHCAECLIITDIRELNLFTGVCFKCKPGKKIDIDAVIKAMSNKYPELKTKLKKEKNE